MAITLTSQEYARFLLAQHELDALSRGGVDNWEWYGDSLDNYARDKGCEDWNEFRDSILNN